MFHEFAPNLLNLHFPMQNQLFGIWNNLPVDISAEPDVTRFKKSNLKSYFFLDLPLTVITLVFFYFSLVIRLGISKLF